MVNINFNPIFIQKIFLQKRKDINKAENKDRRKEKTQKNYQHLYYKNQVVITLEILHELSGISVQRLRYHLRKCQENKHFYKLEKTELSTFKKENHFFRHTNQLLVIPQVGYIKLQGYLTELPRNLIYFSD